MIQYLIKFIQKREHVESLLDGKLFMRCAEYYHELERRKGPGRGDIREGNTIPGHGVYRNLNLPIFCLYTVENETVENQMIRISKRVVRGFECENGYLVLIQFDRFTRSLSLCNTSEHAMVGGRVKYGTPSQRLSRKLFCEKSAVNLFIKDPYFKHQKEYRLVVDQEIPEKYVKEQIGNIEQDVLNVDEMHITYTIPGGIRDFATSYAIASLPSNENDYILSI